MASYEFTAAYGVQFSDGVAFTRAPELEGPDGEKVYRFATADVAVAKRLRKLAADGMYGVTEVKPDVDSGDS